MQKQRDELAALSTAGQSGVEQGGAGNWRLAGGGTRHRVRILVGAGFLGRCLRAVDSGAVGFEWLGRIGQDEQGANRRNGREGCLDVVPRL